MPAQRPSTSPVRNIVAGGDFSDAALVRYVFSLTGVKKPRICFLPTASADRPELCLNFYSSMVPFSCTPSHLTLFSRQVLDLRSFLLGQDVILVGGGNTANMLAIWRVHGVDAILREAWERGVVLTGGSAGAICWFEGGSTDSFGQQLEPLNDGLRFLAGSHCPHYNHEAHRRKRYHTFVGGGLPAGYAVDDACALHFIGTKLHRIVTADRKQRAYYVEKKNGKVVEKKLKAEYLGT